MSEEREGAAVKIRKLLKKIDNSLRPPHVAGSIPATDEMERSFNPRGQDYVPSQQDEAPYE